MDGSTAALRHETLAEGARLPALDTTDILENLASGALVLDASAGTIAFANTFLCKQLGFAPIELNQTSIGNLSPDLASSVEKAGKSASVNVALRRKDGSFLACDFRLLTETHNDKNYVICLSAESHADREYTDQIKRYAEFNQSLLDSSDAGILSLTPVRDENQQVVDYRFVAANEANALLTGRSPEQLLGKTLLEEFPGNKDEGLYDIYHQVATTGRPADFEVHYDKDNVEDWFRVRAVQTGVDGVTINFSQITSTKRYELALKELHRLSLDTSLDIAAVARGILAIGQKVFSCPFGLYTEVSDGTYHILETTDNLPLKAGATLPLEKTVCANVVQDKSPLASHDLQQSHPEQAKAGFGAYIGAPLLVDGQPVGTLCFLGQTAKNQPFSESDTDIISMMADMLTARIKLVESQDDLRRSRDELQILFNNMPARIWYKDDKNTILHANKAAAHSMGFEDPNDLENTDTYQLFPEMAAKYHEDDLAVIDSKQPLRNIVESYTPLHGEKGWVSTDKIPLEVPSGDNRLLVVSSDITTLKQREEQLEKLNRNLQEFAFVAAHDLQAPLRQTAMFSQMLRDEIEEAAISENALETLESLEKSVLNMRSMVKNLYHLFSLDTQQIQLLPVDVNAVIERAQASLEEVLQEAQAEISVEDLPTVLGAEDLLAQLFQNLFANAVKYAGSERPHVHISHNQNPAKLVHEIRVQDNGLGIPPEFHEKVFEPFKRLHHKEEVEGAGIGLALCRRISNLHKGTLRIDPKYQDGCCFVLEVPYY
ncbi:MAG: PAS domain-containing protein [Aquisalinus sp.]|nr:PAS domain-containing protein [Aquisalinus sp.]